LNSTEKKKTEVFARPRAAGRIIRALRETDQKQQELFSKPKRERGEEKSLRHAAEKGKKREKVHAGRPMARGPYKYPEGKGKSSKVKEGGNKRGVDDRDWGVVT